MGSQSARDHAAARDFPPTPDAAPAAREFVVAVGGFAAGGDEALRLKTLVSEIVTNAILHARTPFSVSLSHDTDRVRVSVRDGSTSLPVKRDYGANQPTGRGLHIVEALADRWGTDADDTGKTVWFELDRRGV